uniref:Antistasin-like domain-containing protein n=1 Tax=Strongyloides papillosus TaxID=174720 RepID=A0A0N5C7N8_STREA
MYLKIFLDNIEQDTIENFTKLPLTNALDYGLQYDYESAMHYDSHSFSKNGKPTMLPHNSVYHMTMGSRSEATFLDIMMLNLHFCSKICKKRITCEHGFYQDPNSCERCKCIRGFTGRDCFEIEKDRLCGNQYLIADGTLKILNVEGEKDCVYHIISKSKNRILIEVKTVSIRLSQKFCRIFYGHF